MNMKSKNLSKADGSLREAFQDAEPKQILQAILILEPEEGHATSTSKQPEPGEYDTREGYRRAIIDRREDELAELLGPTLQALRDLGLEVSGGRLGRATLVRGAASDLLASLDLPTVRLATLDRAIDTGESGARHKRGGKS